MPTQREQLTREFESRVASLKFIMKDRLDRVGWAIPFGYGAGWAAGFALD
jgi:hypothetical protein